MERLTQTSDRGGVAFTFDLDINCQPSEAKKILKLAEKLKDYEDAEEQGLLIRLPCKVGDPLYRINKGAREPVIRMHIIQLCIKKLRKDRIVIRIDTIDDNGGSDNYYFQFDIGKKIFLTREEAEAKLKEMEGRANGNC